MSVEQVRAFLLDWGVQEIRSCRIGLNDVLIAPGASHELADRARSLPASPSERWPPELPFR